MRSRAIIVLAALSGALVSGGWYLQRGLQGDGSAYERARLFDDVMTHITRYYVDSLGQADLYKKAVDGMLDELGDPHSVFLAPDRLKRLTESTSGRYGGLGIQIEPRDGWIVIIAPLPGTPAERVGLQTGDRIVEIEGKSTQGWTADEALKTLRGAPGTSVALIVERPGVEARLPFKITRREIHMRAVQHAMLLDREIGYVKLNVFSEATTAELRDAVDSLRREGMKELVLDLRDNPGGLLDEGVSVSDLFLDPGHKIVGMRGRTREANRDFVDRTAQRWPDLPLAVLVDSGSASASEIVAGALQDHDRAVILGTTTFGKGSAQSLFPMSGGGALKLTTAIWYTPSGRSINKPMTPRSAKGEGSPDENGEAADTSKRERFRTDAGRTIFGGGGIAPDLVIADQALSEAEQDFQQALGRAVPKFRDALNEYALSLKGARTVPSPEFTVTPAMREELLKRMRKRGVEVDRAVYEAAEPLVSRLIAYEVTRYVFGTEAEFRRRAKDDSVLVTALDIVRGAVRQAELFSRVNQRRQLATGS